LVFSSNLPGCFGRRLHWGEARANLRLPSQGRPDIFNPLPGRVQSYGGRLCFSDAVAQLKPSFHSLPVLRVPLFPKAGKNRFQDNARDQHGRGREIEREEQLRFIQEPQVYAPVGELDRGLQMFGNVLRQNGCSHSERLSPVWIIPERPVSSISSNPE
jgi:hypothetical protein